MTAAAVGLAVLAGLAGSVKVAVMGRFGAQIGISWPRAVGIGLLGLGAALSLAR